MGTTPAALQAKMAKRLTIFASGDKSGMAQRLFAAFWSKQTRVTFLDDPNLTQAADRHLNIRFFCDAALSAPNVTNRSPGKVRIHQAKAAGWDITKLVALDDEDLNRFGASSDSIFSSNAAIGITAWWQLQHQHG